MNCSQISAHRSSVSSGSCGCRLSEQCHTCASRAPITRPFLSRSAIVTWVPNASRGSSRNRASATASRAFEQPPLPHPDRLRRPGDQVRVLVLLALALPDQVEQHPVRLAAAGDVRDHRPTPVSRRSCATSCVDLGERLLQPRALRTCPEMFAAWASWLTLFATVASSRRVLEQLRDPAAAARSASPHPTAPTRPSAAAPTPPAPPRAARS